MSTFTLLVFAHVTTMFFAVLMSYGPTLLFLLALRTRRTENVRAVGLAVQPIVRAIPVAYVLGAVFGVAAAIVGNYNVLSPWLVISYVLFIVLLGIGAAFAGPRMNRVGGMIATAPDGPLPPDVYSAATANGFVWVEVLDFVGLVAVIFVMVVKPLS